MEWRFEGLFPPPRGVEGNSKKWLWSHFIWSRDKCIYRREVDARNLLVPVHGVGRLECLAGAAMAHASALAAASTGESTNLPTCALGGGPGLRRSARGKLRNWPQ